MISNFSEYSGAIYKTFAIWHFPYINHLLLLSKPKLFRFVRKILYIKYRRKFVLRGHIFIFLKISLQPSLYCIGYLQLRKLIFRVCNGFSFLQQSNIRGKYFQYLQYLILKNFAWLSTIN